MPIPEFSSPIILGTKMPQIRFHGDDSDRLFYSLTNQNLFPTEKDFTSEGSLPAVFLFGRYIANNPEEFPFFGPDLGQLPSCWRCVNGRQVCPMLVKEVHQRPYKTEMSEDTAITVTKFELWEEPRLDLCPCLSTLMEETQTEAEKRLFQLYYLWAICGGMIAPAPNNDPGVAYYSDFEQRRYVEFIDEWEKRQLMLPDKLQRPEAVTSAIIKSILAPALLPQYWLRWQYDSTQKPTKESLEMSSRADFVAFIDGERHVIEVDGPSHYARFDKTANTYHLDEEEYTRNLRMERNLAKNGWRVHRFSNWEVMNDDIKVFNDLMDVLGLVAYAGWHDPEPKLPGVELI